MAFDRFAVVRVPFPFTDRDTAKNRPALVLSDDASFNTPAGHLVMAMIISRVRSKLKLLFGGVACSGFGRAVASLPDPAAPDSPEGGTLG